MLMTKQQIIDTMTALVLEIENLEDRKKSEMKKYNDEINSKNNRVVYLAHKYADFDKEKDQMELDFDGKPLDFIGSGENPEEHPEKKITIIDLRDEKTEENELVDAPELSN